MEPDDDIKLPDDTLQILNEFLAEKADSKNDLFSSENWNLSQFWYSDETQKAFGRLIKKLLLEHDELSIGLLSCPSLYQTIRSIADNVKIFEFDERFTAFGNDFQLYDFNRASEDDYLKEYQNKFDLLIVDPPFLSEECLEKTAIIVKRLKNENSLVVLNTGLVQKEHAARFLNLRETSFKPQHKNNLANEFASFANFDMDKYM